MYFLTQSASLKAVAGPVGQDKMVVTVPRHVWHAYKNMLSHYPTVCVVTWPLTSKNHPEHVIFSTATHFEGGRRSSRSIYIDWRTSTSRVTCLPAFFTTLVVLSQMTTHAKKRPKHVFFNMVTHFEGGRQLCSLKQTGPPTATSLWVVPTNIVHHSSPPYIQSSDHPRPNTT